MPSLNRKEGRREHNAYVSFLYMPIDTVDYVIECVREIVLDSLGGVLSRCIECLKELLRPIRLKERSVFRQIEGPTESQYCMSSLPLSFFDPFSCVSGVPAYHLTQYNAKDRCEDATPSNGAGSSEHEGNDSEEIQPKEKKDSTSETPSKESIEVCCFSSDGSKFAICYISGAVTIYDTDHGSVWAETRIDDSPATSVSFLGNKSSVLLIYTKDYALWKWDVVTSCPQLIKKCEGGTPSRIDGEVSSQRSNFYMSGERFLLFSIINSQSGPILEIASLDLSETSLWLSYPVYVEKNYVISKTVVSHEGSSILVGLVDKELDESRCLLWPSYNEAPTSYKTLHKGTIGSWSTDSKHVVTWIMTYGLDLDADDVNSAFIWNVEEMRENLTNFGYSFQPIIVKNPFGGKVLWCQMTQGVDEKDRLIMSIGGELTRVLFWDVTTSTHTHTIETGISPKDMILCKKEAWIESCLNQNCVKGLNSMDMTKDGSTFGATLGLPHELLVWDAQLGVEVLRISLKDLEANQFKDGLDLMMSPSSTKFAVIGNDEVIVFCPSARSKNEQRPKDCLETQMVQFENPCKSQANLPSFKMSFSGDGESLGVLCIGLPKMQVWNLPQGTSCTIKSTQNEDSGNIQDFCLSNNGKYLVIYIGNQVQIMDCTAKRVSQMIGAIKIDSPVVSMGIKDDCTELVLCMEDGSICLYKLSHEDVHYNDEATPSTSIIHQFAGHRLSLIERFKLWFKRSSEDVNESLIDNNEEDGQLDVKHTSIQISSGARLLSYTRHLLAEEVDDATFQVSPNFKEGIRISKSRGVETWNLETKMQLFGPFKEINSIERKAWAYSHVSSITEQAHNELESRKAELVDGTSIDLSERTTLVQSSREGIIVAGNCFPRSYSEWRDQSTFNTQYTSNECDDSSSVYVLNLNDRNCARRLSGKKLCPDKGLIISNDGRRIACLAGECASKVIVWNAYASQGLLPDYHVLALNHSIESKKAIRRDIVPMIDSFGVNFFNFRHANRLSILDEVVWCSKNELLRTILKYALKKEVKVSYIIKNSTQIWFSEVADYVQASIFRTSPQTLRVILQYLLKRVCHEYEMAKVLADSLFHSLRDYPQIFHSTVQDPRLLGNMREIEVAQDVVKGHKFGVKTSTSLNLSEKETRDFWKQDCKDAQGSNVGLTPSLAWTLPYKGACDIGATGLLREMIMNEAHHSLFGSLAISAIVQFKWRFEE